MLEYLTFKQFISTEILITLYYMIAIIVPLLFLIFKNKIEIFNQNRYAKSKLIIFIFFIFFELTIRMATEFLIAYLQIRDALMKIY